MDSQSPSNYNQHSHFLVSINLHSGGMFPQRSQMLPPGIASNVWQTKTTHHFSDVSHFQASWLGVVFRAAPQSALSGDNGGSSLLQQPRFLLLTH